MAPCLVPLLPPRAQCQLTPTLNSAIASKAEELLGNFSLRHSSFLPQGVFASLVHLSQTLVWRPQPSIHTGLAGPMIPVQECLLPMTFSRFFPRNGTILIASKNWCSVRKERDIENQQYTLQLVNSFGLQIFHLYHVHMTVTQRILNNVSKALSTINVTA